MNIPPDYLESARAQFKSYRQLGEKAMAQISDEALNHRFGEESNSIATIVKHLHGNMLSRWTDFLTSDGEKEWRQRDAEFENDIPGREELNTLWQEGWACLENALAQLSPEDMSKVVFIRGQEHSVLEAINRQLTHYAYHIGQIVFAAKIFAGEAWSSLSIPRNKSAEFNAKTFGQKNS